MSGLIETITANVNKSGTLIDNILALAEAGQIPKEISLVDVTEVVREVLDERAGSINEKGIRVKVGDSLGNILGSPTQIYQIFTNLVGNAIKHNNSESPVMEISYLGDDESGRHRYLVRDNGSGITSEDIDMVFVPFFKGKTGETGIGLSTVERIIKVYDGEIKAYNDNGACFEFTLRDFREG
jgi:signal transduction histidine kinase